MSTQQDILRTTYPEQKLGEIPQMWAMYKEVMAYYANGVSYTLSVYRKSRRLIGAAIGSARRHVPTSLMGVRPTRFKLMSSTVTSLLADDNWGNLMAVLPDDRRSPGGGGVYYHADCRYCSAPKNEC